MPGMKTLVRPHGIRLTEKTERRFVMELKKFEKPVILKEEKYQTANLEHCHQVKEECMPYQLKA